MLPFIQPPKELRTALALPFSHCECSGQSKAILHSFLPHGMFRAVFKAVICFPIEQLGQGPVVQLMVQKCDSDLNFVMGKGVALSFLGKEESLAIAFVTQHKVQTPELENTAL